ASMPWAMRGDLSRISAGAGASDSVEAACIGVLSFRRACLVTMAEIAVGGSVRGIVPAPPGLPTKRLGSRRRAWKRSRPYADQQERLVVRLGSVSPDGGEDGLEQLGQGTFRGRGQEALHALHAELVA